MTRRESGDGADLVAELRRLGRQLGRTIDAAWGSEERMRAQDELKAGARALAEELERTIREARGAGAADAAARTSRTAAEGLRWMSAELESLADRFTPREDP